jgi:purine-cytosine permease-like protein
LTPTELASLKDAGLLVQFTSHRLLLDAGQIGDLIEKGVLQGPPAVLPGPMTYHVAGIAGVLCVLAAGWTTANPTLYRAGLAFQAIVPKSSRFMVTLLTGAFASLTAVFPLVTMRLLDFVAMWGMILMPMGAVIFVDFWLSKRFGFRQNYAEISGNSFNWAAGLAWLLTIVLCTGLVLQGGVQIFFVSLPGWFVAAFLYVVLSRLWQKKTLQAVTTPVVPK